MHKHHSAHHSLNGKNFIILPIVFCVVFYLISFAIIIPTASTYISAASLFFSNREKDFSEDYNNIFVPVEDNTFDSSTETSKTTNKTTPTVKNSDVNFPSVGDQFGELIIDDCQIDDKLFFGDDNIALANGVGIYSGSSIPGYGKTVLIAGHNNTYFNGLKYAKKGQKIKIRTNYGNYLYKITDVQVKLSTDQTAYNLKAAGEKLILYTCYPFDELGLTPKRCFVYADLVSGTVIDKNS